MMKTIIRCKTEERGEIAVLLACYMVILLLCLGLTLDLGNTYLLHLKMRNAADLAASGIGLQLPASYTASREAAMQSLAEQIVTANGIDLDDTELSFELIREGDLIYAAKVILYREVHHSFASLYLRRSSTIRVGNFVTISEDTAGASGYRIQIIDA